jgi:hypothetical protein
MLILSSRYNGFFIRRMERKSRPPYRNTISIVRRKPPPCFQKKVIAAARHVPVSCHIAVIDELSISLFDIDFALCMGIGKDERSERQDRGAAGLNRPAASTGFQRTVSRDSRSG